MEANRFRLNRLESLLLIIDLQDKLMKAMKYREKVESNTRLLLTLAAETGVPVVVTEQYPRGLGPTVPSIAVLYPEGVHIIDKMSFSAYTARVRETLSELNRPKIIVTGTETHVCVYQTVRDLLQAGYIVHVAKDAVCSRFTCNYRSGLTLMKDMGAVLSNTETIFFDILQRSDTAEFKRLSPLLK